MRSQILDDALIAKLLGEYLDLRYRKSQGYGEKEGEV
jgi:hypothetical protein